MIKKIIPYILSAACVLSACSTDFFEPDSPTQFPGDDEILSLTVIASQSVIHDGVSSRAKNEDDVLYTEFVEGDSIGVIVMDAAENLLVDNVPFRYDGTNWIFDAEKDGEQKRPYYDAAMSKYIVYFPYTPTADGCTSVDSIKALERFAHKDNQNSKEDYLYSDIMVWTSNEGPIKSIKAEMSHVYDTFSLAQPKVKWDIVPTGKDFEYTTMDETLSDLIIEYIPTNGKSIVLKDNETNLIYRGTDRSYRYLLPEDRGGVITWQYTYRGITFHGKREIPATPSGTRISSSDTGYMGKLPGPKMEFSDFYCSTRDNDGKVTGYVIPWDAGEQLSGHHCIGLVAGVGQNQDDLSDYSRSGIKKQNCQGYVISLTNTFAEPFLVKYGIVSVLPWGININETFTNPIHQHINDWSGYYNHQKIIEYSAKRDNGLLDFPAAYTCEYYGKYTVGTNENDEPIEVPVPEGKHTGLEAPDNTSGWFLPTVHMLYSVNARDGFTIGGTLYTTTTSDGKTTYALDKLFNDRLETIKKYAENDLIYQKSICKYLELAQSPNNYCLWGSNHHVLNNSVMYIKVDVYGISKEDGSNCGSDLRARAFLAF